MIFLHVLFGQVSLDATSVHVVTLILYVHVSGVVQLLRMVSADFDGVVYGI